MKDTAFAFGVAKIRAVENRLLKKSDIEQIITAVDMNEALKLVADKGYGEAAQTDDLGRIFDAETKNLWELLKEVSCGENVFEIFLYKNDYHNLKVILKGFSSGKEFEHMLMYPVTVEPEEIKDAVREDRFELLPPKMTTAAKKAYELLTREDDIKGACMVIDKAANEAFYEGAVASGNEFLIELASLTVDLLNIKIAWRCAKTDMEQSAVLNALCDVKKTDINTLATLSVQGEEEIKKYISSVYPLESIFAENSDFSVFEKWCDNYIMEKASKAKYKALGIEPIFAYYIAKQAEMKTLHIVLAGKKSGLDADVIRERVRELYV